MSAGHGAARRRRERQLQALYLHERMTVRTGLAVHAGHVMEEPQEGVAEPLGPPEVTALCQASWTSGTASLSSPCRRSVSTLLTERRCSFSAVSPRPVALAEEDEEEEDRKKQDVEAGEQLSPLPPRASPLGRLRLALRFLCLVSV